MNNYFIICPQWLGTNVSLKLAQLIEWVKWNFSTLIIA